MQINEMSKEDFKSVPYYTDAGIDLSNLEFNSIVIIPTDEMHESGYMCMDYVLVSIEEYAPICKVGGMSDVLEIDGIGGYGYGSILNCKRLDGKCVLEPKGWCIDCLPCGYLRLFSRDKMFLNKHYIPTSSFEVYAK